jgi:hypothetical protein
MFYQFIKNKNILPKFLILGYGTNKTVNADNTNTIIKQNKNDQIRKSLIPIRYKEKEIRLRWENDEDGYRKLPARAWPSYQPNVSELDRLEKEIKNKCINNSSDNACLESKFNLATCLIFNTLNPKEGLDIYLDLAKLNYLDGIVGAGVVLLEGLGVDAEERKGLELIQKSCNLDSIQGYYELGCAYYTGVGDNVLKEDEVKALELFKLAALNKHMSGMYMVADYYLFNDDGDDDTNKNARINNKDIDESVVLLYDSADLGHRFARQRVKELLEKTR